MLLYTWDLSDIEDQHVAWYLYCPRISIVMWVLHYIVRISWQQLRFFFWSWNTTVETLACIIGGIKSCAFFIWSSNKYGLRHSVFFWVDTHSLIDPKKTHIAYIHHSIWFRNRNLLSPLSNSVDKSWGDIIVGGCSNPPPLNQKKRNRNLLEIKQNKRFLDQKQNKQNKRFPKKQNKTNVS